MITQVSNNRPSGSTAKQCDAGIPVVGRTDATGQYQIIKVAADGTVATNAGATPLSDTTTPYSLLPSTTPLPIAGALGANLFLGTYQVADTITAGVYRINPAVFFEGTTGGSINIALVKSSGLLNTYLSGLAPFTDAVAPTSTNFANGLAYFWHNNAVVSFGGSVAGSFNRSNSATVYLESGTYNIAVWVDTGITTGLGAFYTGLYEFSKV